MHLARLLTVASAASLVNARETVLGVYLFSRHGDRTAKSTPPANLTDLGYQEIFNSGTYFRNRYIEAGATSPLLGISPDLVKESQISVSAPVDTVLQNSALGFVQGLYPPVGSALGSSALRNGAVVQSPLDGYQLIPIQTVSAGTGSEDSAWLQDTSNCANAEISSDSYFSTLEYMTVLDETDTFYLSLSPMINRTFSTKETSYQNAYTIFDLLNVASIHNASNDFPSSQLLTPEVFFQLRTRADEHEFNLAYNNSEPIRAVTGAILAAEVVEALNGTITGTGAKLNIQFGAYAGFLSFFGLSNLTQASKDFYGIPDYASTMVWELVTNATATTTSFPPTDEISVRFLFHNGTTSNISEPVAFPLFGQSQTLLSWNDFVDGMNKFAIGSQSAWCIACGNSTGVCSPSVLSSSPSGSSGPSTGSSGSNNGGGISKAVAGTIGALVTLGVILGAELLIVLLGGLRVVSRNRLALTGASPAGSQVKA